MLTGLIMRGCAMAFIQLPQPHRRGKNARLSRRRKISRVERDVADTHIIEVADPTVIRSVRNGTDQQRLVIDSESVRPSLGRHVDAVGIDPDFAAIPHARDMVPFSIG
jgi:hypothetical protein